MPHCRSRFVENIERSSRINRETSVPHRVVIFLSNTDPQVVNPNPKTQGGAFPSTVVPASIIVSAAKSALAMPVPHATEELPVGGAFGAPQTAASTGNSSNVAKMPAVTATTLYVYKDTSMRELIETLFDIDYLSVVKALIPATIINDEVLRPLVEYARKHFFYKEAVDASVPVGQKRPRSVMYSMNRAVQQAVETLTRRERNNNKDKTSEAAKKEEAEGDKNNDKNDNDNNADEEEEATMDAQTAELKKKATEVAELINTHLHTVSFYTVFPTKELELGYCPVLRLPLSRQVKGLKTMYDLLYGKGTSKIQYGDGIFICASN